MGNIKNKEAFYHTRVDWNFLNKCFPRDIRPTDIDGFVEINGCGLILEHKQQGQDIPHGQELLFSNICRENKISVLVFWANLANDGNIKKVYRIRTYTWNQAKVRAIEKVGLAKGVRDQALNDAQDVATAVLYAEAKMGELLKAIPKPKFDKQLNGSLRGTTESLPNGITKKQSHYAQALAENQGAIEEVIKECIKKEEIPTRYEVLKKSYALNASVFGLELEIYIGKLLNGIKECDAILESVG